ncbi:MAG TPA: GTPase Era [Terriglobia bacterium]|nr:GTPase Era [Terriglobia bacterium]
MPEPKTAFKSGFVAVVGRPNSGKSTLVNALVGAKVSIVTPVAQTTRNRILGIVHRPDAQVVLMDTPGIHRPLSRLNQQMMSFVREALDERELTLLIADASAPLGKGDEFVVQLVAEHAPRAILLLNKIDRVHKPKLLPLIDRYSKLHNFEEIFPISALKGMQLDDVMAAIIARLPEGPAYFPPDIYTDQPEKFLAAEIIREYVIRNTRQELPHVSAVLIDRFEESETITRIYATVLVERESQKPIVIGAGGNQIKQIGTEARLELEKVFPPKVFLQLFVRVEPNWRDSRHLIASLDYRQEG